MEVFQQTLMNNRVKIHLAKTEYMKKKVRYILEASLLIRVFGAMWPVARGRGCGCHPPNRTG